MENDKKVEENVEELFSHDEYKLVFVMVKRGFESDVLEAAKAEGHYGATIMQAKGISKIRKKFLGVSVDPDYTSIMMIVKSEIVVPVIKSIYAVTDFKSEARGMIFVLPISYVCGMDSAYDSIDVV